jgi:hypothetical protein
MFSREVARLGIQQVERRFIREARQVIRTCSQASFSGNDGAGDASSKGCALRIARAGSSDTTQFDVRAIARAAR